MNNRLVLFIDEHWPKRPAAPWVLLDSAGRKSAQGESEPRHWPAADECVVVLGAAQTLWQALRLPRAPRREEVRLLRYALEDCLLHDADSQHFTVTHRHPDADGVRTGVLVVARERLRAILAQLAALDRPPVSVWSELEMTPAGRNAWHLAVTPGGLVLRIDEHHGQALDEAEETALPLLQHASARARAENRVPEALVIHGAPPGREPDREAWPSSLGIPLREERTYQWWSGRPGANLLHGEFAPRHRHASWVARLAAPAWIAAASVAALLATELGYVLWQQHQLGGIESRMERVFQAAMPNTPAIAPAAQLHRHLNDLRAAHGRLRPDDMLALLDSYGEARGITTAESIARLDYAEGQLRLTAIGLPTADVDALRLRLASRGLVAHVETDSEATTIVIAPEVIR